MTKTVDETLELIRGWLADRPAYRPFDDGRRMASPWRPPIEATHWERYRLVGDDDSRLSLANEFERFLRNTFGEGVYRIACSDGLVSYQGGPSECEIAWCKNDDLKEKAPPGDKAERFIKKNKSKFRKRYGDDWGSYLYGTAWKQFGKKKRKKTKESIDDDQAVADLVRAIREL